MRLARTSAGSGEEVGRRSKVVDALVLTIRGSHGLASGASLDLLAATGARSVDARPALRVRD
jgi:hypothetical protein